MEVLFSSLLLRFPSFILGANKLNCHDNFTISLYLPYLSPSPSPSASHPQSPALSHHLLLTPSFLEVLIVSLCLSASLSISISIFLSLFLSLSLSVSFLISKQRTKKAIVVTVASR